MTGPAPTIETAADDTHAIHLAPDAFGMGDALVADGAVHDTGGSATASLSIVARTRIHHGPYRNGPGETGSQNSVCGGVIHPGDVMAGEEDGGGALPTSVADRLPRADRPPETIPEGVREGSHGGAGGK